MKTKSVYVSIFTLVLTILAVSPVLAGGWAVVSLDELPDDITAGEALTIGFTVRQHGVSPMGDLSPSVIATHAETSETFSVTAQSQGEVGHYIAELNFPQEGLWYWSIQAFTLEQPMPPLTIRTDSVMQASTGSQALPLGTIGLGLLAVIAGVTAAFFLVSRKNFKWAIGLLAAALLFTSGGLALAASQPREITTDTLETQSLMDEGEALFVSKGCFICHVHAETAIKVKAFSGFSGPTGIAPDLSQYAAKPEFLRRWLADPVTIKPDTYMPNLGLTADEIEALIAFLAKDTATLPTNVAPKICPVTQPSYPPFIPPKPYPAETATKNEFWYGTDDLWTMLLVNGVWQELPYHNEEGGHYVNKLVWWNQEYDWQTEPQPEFTVTARRLDGSAPSFETSEATNTYTPEFGSAILTGVEIPTAGCWEFTGRYQDHELSFVVWVAP